MPNVTVKMDWTMTLSTEELRLVLKALGGRLKPEEVGDAKALGDRLTALRAATTETTLKWNAKLLANLDEAGGA